MRPPEQLPLLLLPLPSSLLLVLLFLLLLASPQPALSFQQQRKPPSTPSPSDNNKPPLPFTSRLLESSSSVSPASAPWIAEGQEEVTPSQAGVKKERIGFKTPSRSSNTLLPTTSNKKKAKSLFPSFLFSRFKTTDGVLASPSSPSSSSSPYPSFSTSSSATFPSAALPMGLPGVEGPFRLTFDKDTDTFVFQTATVELQRHQQRAPSPPLSPASSLTGAGATAAATPPPPPERVRLIGSVHIAEPSYYHQLNQECATCDVVLYEMITSENNVLRDETDTHWPQKEQLGVELAATTELRRMALTHGLEPQLDNMHFFGKKNWYLSDINREKLCLLQRARGERPLDEASKGQFTHLQEMAQIFWDGFTSRGKVLPKFLFMKDNGKLDGLPFRILRLCMWLTPAPELQLLLLDWARQYPPAGGLSKILRSMVGAVVHGDFLTLRRLAFSQMLTSSQGSPPPEVLVLERNSKVVLDVEQALQSGSSSGSGGVSTVGVLYGGLHMMDMEAKLSRHLNFTRVPEAEGGGVKWHTAWTMPAYTAQRQALVAALCVALPLLHLGVGALDWSATFGGLAHDAAQQLELGGGGVAGATATAAAAVTTAANEDSAIGWQEVLLYLLRHMYIYYGLSRWVVEWEKQLFEMR